MGVGTTGIRTRERARVSLCPGTRRLKSILPGISSGSSETEEAQTTEFVDGREPAKDAKGEEGTTTNGRQWARMGNTADSLIAARCASAYILASAGRTDAAMRRGENGGPR
jgi:hypothetical protein